MAHTETEQWERFSRKIDRRISRRLTRPLHARLLQVAAPNRGDRVLDVGAGSGTLVVKTLATGARAVGVDGSDAMARLAATKAPGRFAVGRAERLPVAPHSVDVVVTSLSLHHWESPEAGLEEITQVLRPGGRVVIADIDRAGALTRLYNTMRRHRSHGRYIRRHEYDELLRGAGLVLLSQEVVRRRWVVTAARRR